VGRYIRNRKKEGKKIYRKKRVQREMRERTETKKDGGRKDRTEVTNKGRNK